MPARPAPPTAARSAVMRSIRGTGTKPELALEAALGLAGSAAVRNDRSLPGSPDFAFHGRRLAVFVDGAFWHGRGPLPRTNAEWWREKFRRTRERDERNDRDLRGMGWRVLRLDADDVLRDPIAAAAAVAAME